MLLLLFCSLWEHECHWKISNLFRIWPSSSSFFLSFFKLTWHLLRGSWFIKIICISYRALGNLQGQSPIYLHLENGHIPRNKILKRKKIFYILSTLALSYFPFSLCLKGSSSNIRLQRGLSKTLPLVKYKKTLGVSPVLKWVCKPWILSIILSTKPF